MDNIKNDAYYIQKIRQDLEFIVIHMQDIGIQELNENEILLDSMLFRMIQLSENAKRLSEEYKQERKRIPWNAIYGLRNRIVHDYGNVDLDVVFETLKNDKPYFFPRLVAYIIDVTLVSIVCSGILFLFPKNENYSKYLKEYQEVQTNFIDNKIEADEYIHKVADITYDIDYSNVLSMIVEVVLLILYFIVFQFYNKGQTFGKKLMKLRVVNNNGNELTLNQVTCRALIIDSILINLFMIAALLFLGRNYYYYASLSLQILSGIIIFVTLMMIFFRKDGRGLHDVVTGTKVIQEN